MPADAITRLRTERGLTQEDVAEHVGVTVRTVRRWEAGTARPRNSHLLRLAMLLGVDPRELS